LAALLVASVVTVAIAAKPTTATVTLSALAASGINGTADLKIEQQSGLVRVHESISGLTPGVQYDAAVFSGGCGVGSRIVLGTFTANAAGKANFVTVAAPQVSGLVDPAAMTIQASGNATILSCGVIEF